ncbi:MAG: hypothetical protein GWN01_09175 [Nitrosopumilaceae archaeon]|nr:C40 family peptidase [Nitrosopumilaceae archaeon]NIU87781.1 hypothetical protein [Nitrosopumilaceae archaeon]NIV65164.1 hypothetical protein [Nitrosopumilaceae archaeon]NIX61679.1 hypothetical protein [Nitrosopumilaceae archaeon]
MTLRDFVTTVLDTPFVEQGRSFDGLDCWGLVYLAYKHILNIELPTYINDYEIKDVRGTDRLGCLIRNRMQNSWYLISTPKPMDVALFRIVGRPVHVALLIDKRRALHAESKVGTFIEHLNSPMWSKRLDGIYRYKQ